MSNLLSCYLQAFKYRSYQIQTNLGVRLCREVEREYYAWKEESGSMGSGSTGSGRSMHMQFSPLALQWKIQKHIDFIV